METSGGQGGPGEDWYAVQRRLAALEQGVDLEAEARRKAEEERLPVHANALGIALAVLGGLLLLLAAFLPVAPEVGGGDRSLIEVALPSALRNIAIGLGLVLEAGALATGGPRSKATVERIGWATAVVCMFGLLYALLDQAQILPVDAASGPGLWLSLVGFGVALAGAVAIGFGSARPAATASPATPE